VPYLLDTNILSELMRHPRGRVADRIAQAREQICTSIIVLAELRFGIAKNRSRRMAVQLSAILDGIEVVPFEAPADAAYAGLRERLERAGRPINANDMLIAAHALALGMVLVTDNEREFNRIEGLAVENWLR
jgi:tRNA(fMet)-specific endonuclease VapC